MQSSSLRLAIAVAFLILIAVIGLVLLPAGVPATTALGTEACRVTLCHDVALTNQIGGSAVSVAVQGSYAYLGAGPQMLILDITDPAHPVLVGRTPVFPNVVQDVIVAGDFAYIATGASGVRIFDISDPVAPMALGVHDTPGSARASAVAGTHLYVADLGSGLRVVDISDPQNPVEAGFFDTPGNAWGVAVAGDYAYVADGFSGLRVLDISNPAAPADAGSIDTPGDGLGVIVAGATVYFADGARGIRMIDVTNPATPVSLGFYDTPGQTRDIVLSGSLAYLADAAGGARVVNVADPAAPVEAGSFGFRGQAYGVALSGSWAFLADFYGGMWVVDVTNPALPVDSGQFDYPGYAYDVALSGTHLYAATGVAGLRVFDITNPAAPAATGAYDTPGHAWAVDAAGSTVYVADGASGLQIVDVTDPAAPFLAGALDTPTLAVNIAVSGTIAYVADGATGLRLIDVTDPASPSELGFYDSPGDVVGVAVSGTLAYAADGATGLRVVDVSDPTAPVEVGFIDTPGVARDVALAGALVAVADDGAGLRLIDVSNPTAPVEVGFFDTPGGVYGVAVSEDLIYLGDRDRGLRVLNVSDPAAPVEYGFYDTPGFARRLVVAGKTAHVADEYGGLTTLTYLAQDPPTPTPTVTPTPTATPTPDPFAVDTFEPDNGCADAKPVLPNSASQNHNFHQVADVDWVRFEARAGVAYVIEADVPLGSPADVALELYPGCAELPAETQDHVFTPNIRLSFRAPADGPLFIKVLNQDPSVAGAYVTYDLSLSTPEERLPGALVIVGGRLRQLDTVQPNIHFVTDAVYDLFRDQGYGDDRIYYLTTDLTLPGADAMPTANNLRGALTSWALDRVGPDRPLTLYLMDHGGVDRFYLDELFGERLDPDDLDAWLDQLETQRPGLKVNIFIESCHAGSFIAPFDGSVSQPDRVVITSTDVKSLAWASDEGATFSDGIVAALRQGASLESSFRKAAAAVSQAHPGQRPWLDADGDGLANRQADFDLAGQRGFAFPGTLDDINWAPHIFAATGPTTIEQGHGVISADIRDDDKVRHVWAVIYPPSYTPPVEGEALVTDILPAIVLRQQPGGGSLYAAEYPGFDEPGVYRVVIYAEDDPGVPARPLSLLVNAGYLAYMPTVLR